MAITLKTGEQIERMRRAGHIVRLVLDRLGQIIAPGLTTEDLDREAYEVCTSHGAQCLFKGVPGRDGAGPFRGNICASINSEVVHGIPSTRRVIREGDIVSVDFGDRLDGWCGDAATTFVVGEVGPKVQHLVDVTRNSLAMAVSMCRPGEKWSNIAGAMQSYVEGEGFSVVREFVGHGIGTAMHEDPKVPNFVSRELLRRDITLQPGLVIAIEPMVNMGGPDVQYGRDGWVILTVDGLPSAHFEHTVAITDKGVEVLTT